MPRTWELEVQPWPELVEGRRYRMEVTSISKSATAPVALLVAVRHMDGPQESRRHEISLPLPLFPENLSTVFFRALGFETGVGSKLNPQDAVGRQLLVTFGPLTEGGAQGPVAFHPIEEKKNGSTE